jgi:hypothetical protein
MRIRASRARSTPTTHSNFPHFLLYLHHDSSLFILMSITFYARLSLSLSLSLCFREMLILTHIFTSFYFPFTSFVQTHTHTHIKSHLNIMLNESIILMEMAFCWLTFLCSFFRYGTHSQGQSEKIYDDKVPLASCEFSIYFRSLLSQSLLWRINAVFTSNEWTFSRFYLLVYFSLKDINVIAFARVR